MTMQLRTQVELNRVGRRLRPTFVSGGQKAIYEIGDMLAREILTAHKDQIEKISRELTLDA